MIVSARLTGQRSCRVDGLTIQKRLIQLKMLNVIAYAKQPIRAHRFPSHRLIEINIPVLHHTKLHTASEPGSTERGKLARIFQFNSIWLNLSS